jgi:hypothetical protein
MTKTTLNINEAQFNQLGGLTQFAKEISSSFNIDNKNIFMIGLACSHNEE